MTLTGLLTSSRLLKQRYRILEQVGRGGFAAVYKAEDTGLRGRLVAVKEMSQSRLTPEETVEAAEAFKGEALLLAGLRHPNLPRIYDHFRDGGRWYLVMDFIEGETLEEYLAVHNGGRLPIAEALACGIQLCTVLDYLHTRQPLIIFRDLKPANVMRTPEGHLYLIDFGIARHFKPGQARDTIPFGSPGYAAPEQYGRGQTTPRADLYSLGVTLHQLLSGYDPSQTPFRLPPLPRMEAPHLLDLELLITQLLEMDEERRPPNAALVGQELQRIAALEAARSLERVPVEARQRVYSASSATRNPEAPATPSDAVHIIYRQHTAPICALAWSPGGGYLASASLNPSVHVWRVDSGETAFTLKHGSPVKAVAWSRDGTRLAAGGWGGIIQVWDLDTGFITVLYRGHTGTIGGTVNAIAWAPAPGGPGGEIVASASHDRTVQLWRAGDGECLRSYRGHEGWQNHVNAFAWSPDGGRIASGDAEGEIHLWDTATASRLFICRHNAAIAALAWSPDGRTIASAGADGSARLWDADSGEILHTYSEHTGEVRSIAWSPDGSRLASASSDGTARVWRATDLKTISTCNGQRGPVNIVAWSPDGTLLASGGDDRTIQIWSGTS